MNGYSVVQHPGFGGGLNLRDAPDVVDPTQAVDCLNTVFTERGALQSRNGYARLCRDALNNRVQTCEAFYTTAGQRQLLLGCGDRLDVVDTTGATVGSATGLTDGIWDFARYGQPNAERAYAGNGFDTIRRWGASTWTAPTATVDGVPGAMPRAGLLQVDADENRLWATGFQTTTGGPGGAVSSPSHVYVSEAGDPETWLALNSLQFRPGDGERIMGICAFRDLIFVFKETCFFVVYGSSTDPDTGEVIFNYRTVLGAGLASQRALVATREGVYFMAREGVYRTEGDEPTLISALVEPIWLGNVNQFFKSNLLNHASITECAMGAWDERVYLSYPSGASAVNDRTLVFDPRYGWWSIWDIPMGAMARFRVGDTEELVFALASGTKNVGRYRGRGKYTADNIDRAGFAGEPIVCRWRSGWFDFNQSDVKTIRELHLHGQGQFYVGIAKDWETEPRSNKLISIVALGETWGDGNDPLKIWGDGNDDENLWGPPSLIRTEMVRGIATRGKVFSLVFTSLGTDASDLWGGGDNPDDLWGGGLENTDLWSDGSDPGDVWGDGDGTDLWGDGTRTFEGSSGDLWGPSATDPFTVIRLASHVREARQPSVVRTEA